MASGDGEYECSILFLIIFLFTIVSSLTSCFYCFKCFSKQGSPWRRKHFLRKIIWRFHVSLILPYLVHLLGVSNKYSFLDNIINFILKMNAFISLMLVIGVLIPLLSLFSWQFLSLGFLDNSLTLFGPLVPVSPSFLGEHVDKLSQRLILPLHNGDVNWNRIQWWSCLPGFWTISWLLSSRWKQKAFVDDGKHASLKGTFSGVVRLFYLSPEPSGYELLP